MRPPTRLVPLLVLLATLVASPRVAQAALAWSNVLHNGADDVLGMRRARDVAASPDARHVYVTGTTDDAVVIFTRDAITDALAYSDRVVWDGAATPGTTPNLDQPVALALSSDGAFLYVACGSLAESRITWFSRDTATGSLDYLGSIADDSASGFFFLDRAIDVLVSADGENVYVAAFETRAITAMTRDPVTGALSALQVVRDDVGGVDGLEGLEKLAESPDGAFVYAASASRPVTVAGLGGVATFARAADGTLTFLEVERQGSGGVDGLWAPRDVAVSADGANVYVAAGGRPDETPPKLGSVAVFDRESDGTLTFTQSIPESAFGSGEPRGVAVSASGDAVYVIAFGIYSGLSGLTPGKLTEFARDPEDGRLAFDQLFVDDVDDVDGLAGALGITVSPDDEQVYVASEQDDPGDPLRGALAVFARTPVPEPGSGAAAGVALASLGALAHSASASQSRGRRKSL